MSLVRLVRSFPSCGGAGLCFGLAVWLAASSPARAVITANVQVDAANVRSVMSPLGLGLHTSQYYNNLGHPFIDDLLETAGVTTLRFGGGGYADVYHWSVHGLSPWFGDPESFGYIGPNTDFASFVRLLDQVDGGRAVVTVNYGSSMKYSGNQWPLPDYGGQKEEAAAWVAYANADPSIYGTPNDIAIGVDQQGNDWKTAGYWARLRASTPGEFASWATDDGVYDSRNLFLAADRDTPIGVEYWEIGNETFGTGYYGGGNGYSVDYKVPYDGTTRTNHPDLSPTRYGQDVVEFSQLMKSIDPSIKIGAVLNTPPDDYGWGPTWNNAVLAQAADDIDFVMVHWYPQAGNNANGNNLLSQVRTKLPQMINGTTAGQDTGNNAGLRDSLAAHGIPNAEIMVTEFNYFGSLSPTVENAAESLFVADSYATWLELGVTSVQYLELLTKDFLDDENFTVGPAFYGIRMVNQLVSPGEALVATSSTHNDVRVHAALKADGSLGIMFVNANLNNEANITVDIEGILLETVSAEGFRLTNGTTYLPAFSSELGNEFTVSVPQRAILIYIIPAVGAPGDFDGDGDVDGEDFLAWQRGELDDPLSRFDLEQWETFYGTVSSLSAAVVVPEPTNLALLLALSGPVLLGRYPRCSRRTGH